MAIQDQDDPPHGGRGHVHRRAARPGRADGRAGRRRRPHRLELDARLLGADDHAVDPRRPRGLHAGRRRGRRGRRRDRDPHQGHRGHLDGDSSGNDQAMEGRFNGDPYCAAVCPGCGVEWPETRLEGIGETAVRCAACGADARRSRSPTATRSRSTGAARRDRRRRRARRSSPATPRAPPRCRTTRSQNPILTFAPHDIVGLVTRMRPFLGQLRHVAVDDDPRLPQRGRLRRLPGRRAAHASRSTRRSCSSTRPTATWTSTPSAPARSSSARSRSRAAASTSATCTRCRATARSPATPPTSRARSRCRSR